MSGSGAFTEDPSRAPERPTHILVTDELVQVAADALRAANRYPPRRAGGDPGWQDTVEEITVRDAKAVLNAVAPELWQAGYDAGRKRIANMIEAEGAAELADNIRKLA